MIKRCTGTPDTNSHWNSANTTTALFAWLEQLIAVQISQNLEFTMIVILCYTKYIWHANDNASQNRGHNLTISLQKPHSLQFFTPTTQFAWLDQFISHHLESASLMYCVRIHLTAWSNAEQRIVLQLEAKWSKPQSHCCIFGFKVSR